MKRKRYKGRAIKAKQKELKKLDEYNARNYYSDIEYIGRLCVNQNTKEWIEMTMYQLRDRANMYEREFAEYLIDKGIRFIHQAPFVFYGKKIYFADFYLPEHRLVVEIDGIYHNGDSQFCYDKERDANFQSIKIETMRISNQETKDSKTIELRLSQYINRYEQNKRKRNQEDS